MEIIADVTVTKTLKIWSVKGKVTIAKCLLTGRFVKRVLAQNVLSIVNAIEKGCNETYVIDSKDELKSIENFYDDKYDSTDDETYFELSKLYRKIYDTVANEFNDLLLKAREYFGLVKLRDL